MRIGFDNRAYLTQQSQRIRERVALFGGKLYLEFGGKLFDDYHAARVLPGFDKSGKVKLLCELRDQAEIILCISAGAIESSKIRSDVGITYDLDVLRLIDDLRRLDLLIGSVVITQYTGQNSADNFRKKLERRGVRVYLHRLTKGYPSDIDTIVSDEGYGANPYIETSRPLVVVTAPGPGSGKLATCLSQLYHESKRGVRAGYAKYETFPIWDMPLQHPVNLAYEAATADLRDVNMIDPFHLAAYGVTAVNYNRDVEVFPIVKTILQRITGEDLYKSPTDMGVNMIGRCITNDEVVREASCQEIIRRYYKEACNYKQGLSDAETCQRIDFLMQTLGLKAQNRRVVRPALDKAAKSGCSSVAIELPDGIIITGRTNDLMNGTASVILNAIKHLSGLSDEILLISPIVLEPILRPKREVFGCLQPTLTAEEVLLALSISAATNPTAELAMNRLKELEGCEAHSSDMISKADEDTFRKLGVNLTCEPQFAGKELYEP